MKTAIPILPLLATAALGQDPLAAGIDAAMKKLEIPGCVVRVSAGDQVLVDRAYGLADVESTTAMTPDHIFQIGSVTKSITATLLGRLVDRGLVAFDDPIRKHLPESVELSDAVARITLRELATHTSGLPREPVNRRDLPDSPSVMLPYSTKELYAGLAKTSLAHERTQWNYSNLGYAVLGHCLARAAGQPLPKLLKAEIFGPLGMANSGIHPAKADRARFASSYWPEDDEPIARDPWEFGEVAAFSGVFSTAADVSRFLASHCAPDGGPVLAAQTRKQLHTPSADLPQGRRMAMGWFVDKLPGAGSILGHGGEVDGHSACVAVLPSTGLCVVVLCNKGGRSAETVIRAVLGQLPKLMQSGRGKGARPKESGRASDRREE